MSSSFGPAKRLAGEKESVWIEFDNLARKYNPINLGLGFPDSAAPKKLTEALLKATAGPDFILNQYTRCFGHPRLINILSKLYSALMEHPINPQTDILVTVGATEALYCAFMGLINSGDEVILIEPFFDSYEPMTKLAEGVAVFIPLRPSKTTGVLSSADWVLDPDELESKFTPKTKMIIINTPHNPIGKVFSRSELELIANLAKKYNIIVLMDEVYEWVVYEGAEHVRLASMPGMWERTITIGSAGKTFSITGWKIGWAIGHPNLIRALQIVHHNSIGSCHSIIQEAIAVAFEEEISKLSDPLGYWNNLTTTLEKKRDKICKVLTNVGMKPTVPEGGYFVIANISELASKVDFNELCGTNDYKFANWMTKNKKLLSIPLSPFYSKDNKFLGENYIRLCFIKQDDTLEQATSILESFNKSKII